MNRIHSANANRSKNVPNGLENKNDYYSKIVRLPIFLMKVSGLFHQKKDKIYLKTYCGFVLMILWFNFIRLLFIFENNERLTGDLAFKVAAVTWHLLCAITQTVLFIYRFYTSKEEKMINEINLLFEYHLNQNKEIANLRKIMNYILIICLFPSILFWVENCLGIFATDLIYKSFRVCLSPFSKENWAIDCITLKIFSSFCLIYNYLNTAFFIFYFISNCFITYKLANKFNEKFKLFIKIGVIVFNSDTFLNQNFFTSLQPSSNTYKQYFSEVKLEFFRIWHLKLMVLVRSLDDVYNVILALHFLLYIFLSLFLAFLISDWNNNCITGIFKILLPQYLVYGTLSVCIYVVLSSGIQKKVR